MTRLLIVPGLGGSGPEHWQSAWERLDARCLRVEQENWDKPRLSDWVSALDAAIAAAPASVLLVAHSLGSILVSHWAARHASRRVVGALLVAPADVDSLQRTMPELSSFAPAPVLPLPFPSVLIASRDDPYVSFARAGRFARDWHAEFVDVGYRGHINADSQLGTWKEGRAVLAKLWSEAPFELDSRLAADTFLVAESELSLMLLMNDRRYPWLLLVPKRSGVTEVDELSLADRARLTTESHLVALTLRDVFDADKLNVGALGNVVRQLHVHHVVRTLDDPAWPGPVWGHSPREPYQPHEIAALVARLRESDLSGLFRFSST